MFRSIWATVLIAKRLLKKWKLHGKAIGLQGERGTDIELHFQLYDILKALKDGKRLFE